jgi:hypothetical protein
MLGSAIKDVHAFHATESLQQLLPALALSSRALKQPALHAGVPLNRHSRMCGSCCSGSMQLRQLKRQQEYPHNIAAAAAAAAAVNEGIKEQPLQDTACLQRTQ